MRKFVLAAAIGAMALPAAAQAQWGYYSPYQVRTVTVVPGYSTYYSPNYYSPSYYGTRHYGYDRGDYRDYRRDVRRAQRECRRDLRDADSRREYRRELRDCRRDLRQAQREYRRDLRDDYGYYGYNRSSRRYWDGYRWRYRW